MCKTKLYINSKMADRDLQKMPIKFLLTRHSHSCANALVDIYKHRGMLHKLVSVHRPISKFFYTDPELTKEGEIKARQRGKEIYTKYIKQNTDGPLPEIYSSMLYRAQQTADLIRQEINGSMVTGKGKKKNIDEISLLPYISEVGLGYDNKQDTSIQSSIKTCSFFIKQDHVKNPHIPSPSAFLSFITGFIECRGYDKNMHTPDKPYIDAIIVSHGQFMKKLFKTVFKKKFPHGDIKNLDSILLTLSKDDDGKHFIKDAEFHESHAKIDKSLSTLCNTGCDPKKFGAPPRMCKESKKQGGGKRAPRYTRRRPKIRQAQVASSA